MNPSQFELIANLAHFKPASKAREAVKLYMLNSMRQAAIADQLGIKPATVSHAVRRFIKTWKAIKQV